ncbi:MAG: hypothetical protein LLF93_05370 [Bacteroidales bacterium]|nr:hypothetical protein [Bacteroidales bacterium]
MLKIREDIFQYYFYFIQERMSIFWNKYNQMPAPWSADKILNDYKFTNVYRASDRVSQYLIKEIIYNKDEIFNEEDILFRILFFKVFNKIETWEFLENKLGKIKISNFNLDKINQLLAERRAFIPIFSNAYMMTGTHSKYNHLDFKHEKWLQMLKDEMIGDKIIRNILKAKSLNDAYELLRKCSFLGDFLAYQYAIDFNYSPVINFSEDSFVKAGIGAIRGIKKCFEPLENNTYEDAIKYTQDNFEKYQNQFGYTEFKNLFGRPLTLIDIQNCFCETDKYLRAKRPDLQIDNVRIKQKYKATDNPLNLFFPPKWGINSLIKESCLQQNTKELTLF